MGKTCDEILSKLPNLSEYREKIISKTKADHLIERLSYVSEFSPELQREWQIAGERINEKMIFYKNTSNVLIKAKNGNVFAPLSALLLACCAYEYYFVLLDYQAVVNILLSDLGEDEKNKIAQEAKKNQSGFLIDSINNKVQDAENRKKILEFTTDYSAWGGGKTVNRGDFWVSTIYSTFNVVQSRSDVHTLVRYIDTARKSNKLDDNKLYQDTRKVVDKVLDKTHKIDIASSDEMGDPVKGGKNIIFYGAPGTGKSYGITDYIKDVGIKDYDPKKNSEWVYRTTLYPEYEYSDFVGQLQPVVTKGSEDSEITYEFKPGIFTVALNQAVKHPDKHVVLIIEEMSRCNVAGVFGDIFQLLDRDSDGRSEYNINNDLIANYVFEEPKHEVYIPSNLTIIGTVNTSDQNVFAMDTAFKRRFLWEYTSTTVPDDFHNNPNIKIQDLNTNWKDLFTNLNSFIVNELELPEDKQIGAYFIKFPQGDNTDQNTVKEILKDKLLQYLWQDVAINSQQNQHTLFKANIHSFSALYTKFDNEQVFSNDFLKLFEKGDDNDQME